MLTRKTYRTWLETQPEDVTWPTMTHPLIEAGALRHNRPAPPWMLRYVAQSFRAALQSERRFTKAQALALLEESAHG